MNIQEREERDFVVATDADWDRAEASEIGAQNPAQAWILTARDVWHPNPYYVGEIVPHPESEIEWPVEVVSREHPGDTHPLQCDWGDDIPF